MLTRLPPARYPDILTWILVDIPACVLPLAMVTSRGTVYELVVQGQSMVTVPAKRSPSAWKTADWLPTAFALEIMFETLSVLPPDGTVSSTL